MLLHVGLTCSLLGNRVFGEQWSRESVFCKHPQPSQIQPGFSPELTPGLTTVTCQFSADLTSKKQDLALPPHRGPDADVSTPMRQREGVPDKAKVGCLPPLPPPPPPQPQSIFSFAHPQPCRGSPEKAKEIKGHSSNSQELVMLLKRDVDGNEEDTRLPRIPCSGFDPAWW